jgi:hypothetical protein
MDMRDIDLLPLPDWMDDFIIPTDNLESDEWLSNRMRSYAKDCIAAAISSRDAEIKRLEFELNRIECGLLEQIEFHVGQVEELEAILNKQNV